MKMFIFNSAVYNVKYLRFETLKFRRNDILVEK